MEAQWAALHKAETKARHADRQNADVRALLTPVTVDQTMRREAAVSIRLVPVRILPIRRIGAQQSLVPRVDRTFWYLVPGIGHLCPSQRLCFRATQMRRVERLNHIA